MTMDSNTISLIFKLLFTFVLVCKTVTGEPSPITNDINAMIYLQRFGYMNESLGAANLIAIDTYQDAIKDFQRFSGINETGLLDEETILMMNTPRCGNKDHNGQAEHARRRKRYALQGSKWRRTDLTYRISKYPRKVKKSQIDTEIARAFQVWSEVTPLNFIPKKDGRVHIDIKFVVGEHGDGDPFDGPGNTLAHAYFPQYGGDAHFDDEEYWTIDSYTGTNLFQVAAHELGHSLGLGHSSTRESLMAPFYQRYKPNFRLSKDDILGIQSLYGPRTEPQTTAPPKETPYSPPPPPKFPGSTPEPDISDAPDLCQDGRIDAVTRIADGTTYVFKGKHYWKVETNGLADGYPRRISDDWDGLPGDIDAALTWADGKTFIFKGNNYWRFHNRKMDSGYPKNISLGFAGIPNNIDTAFVWSGNGKTYFFKDKLYWRFDSKNDPPVSSRYPKPIKNWVGLPSNIDAAFKWENGLTYFFKGTNYYRFNDNDFEVDSSAKPPFPRQTSVWWFDCKSAANSPFRGSLISGQNRSKFIGALMSNTMDQDLESSAASSSSSSSQIQSDSGSIGTISGSSLSSSSGKNGNHHDSRISSGEEDKEWTIHGRFDHRDLAAAVYSHAIICKTNMILMALSLLLTITRKLTES